MDTDDDLVQNLVDQRTLNFLRKGYDFIKLGKYDEAKMCFENAINSNRKNIDAWLNFGITTSLLDKDGAIQSFENSFRCGVGKREYTVHRFGMLCDIHYRCDPKLPDVKHDFEIAKSNIDERTVSHTFLRSIDRLKKRLTEPVLFREDPEKQPQYDPFFPAELVQDYPEHKFHSEGGNSRVYKCRRKKDGLTVAIKIPKEFDRKKSKDFIDEIAIWRELDHKNIVKIFDYSANPAYIVMEYFPRSLSQSVKPMPTTDALKMTLKLLDALSYAHKKGRIHADIKPDNILMSKKDEPKLSDWGLGQISGLSLSRLTSQPDYTLLYAAPEQVRSEPPDTRTDIWQIGVVLYELITGKNPFDAEDPERIYKKILSEDPVDLPSTHNPNVKWLDTILMTCLQKEQDKRYRSVDDLSHDIEKVLIEDFTRKTNHGSQFVRLTGHSGLIRVHCQKNNYDEVIANLKEIRKLSQVDQIREMIDTQIEAVKTYRSLGMDLDEHIVDDLEKIFRKYHETHIIETP
jgi:tetratricopeptide (TPR) repeat protein